MFDDEYLRMFHDARMTMSFKAKATVYGSLATNVTNGHTSESVVDYIQAVYSSFAMHQRASLHACSIAGMTSYAIALLMIVYLS